MFLHNFVAVIFRLRAEVALEAKSPDPPSGAEAANGSCLVDHDCAHRAEQPLGQYDRGKR